MKHILQGQKSVYVSSKSSARGEAGEALHTFSGKEAGVLKLPDVDG